MIFAVHMLVQQEPVVSTCHLFIGMNRQSGNSTAKWTGAGQSHMLQICIRRWYRSMVQTPMLGLPVAAKLVSDRGPVDTAKL